MSSIYDFTVTLNNGEKLALADLKGQVVLIVNTASRCGFTPQYEGLESLFRRFQTRGLTVIGFPCNQFGQQEPGSDKDIQQFCDLNFNVSFPMSAKIEVNGNNADPLFEFLKDQARGVLGSRGIKWNFTKFIVDPDGNIVDRYAPTTKPAELEKVIIPLLPE